MRKVISLIDTDPFLRENCEKIEQQQHHLTQQMEFLKKQAKDLQEKTIKEIQPHWDLIEDHLKSKGVLPHSYNPKEHFLSFSTEENSLVLGNMDECEHDDPLYFLRKLLT